MTDNSNLQTIINVSTVEFVSFFLNVIRLPVQKKVIIDTQNYLYCKPADLLVNFMVQSLKKEEFFKSVAINYSKHLEEEKKEKSLSSVLAPSINSVLF
jgi:hypothetical protein